ncbi:MAG: hypothetical protein LC800_15465 [Acidobacteria bacterium]|nr:hypothetical protein [Acidobacteriota bacterium]
MLKRAFTHFLIALPLINLTAPARIASAFGQTRRPTPNTTTIVGSWSLTRIGAAESESGRTIKFLMNGSQLGGTYVTNNREEKSISGAKFNGRDLSFKVASLQLYFEMKLVGRDRFEGKMTAYSATERKTPEPVRMIKAGQTNPVSED